MLVVDASQGVEHRPLASCYLALDHDLGSGAHPEQDRPAQRHDPDAVAKEVEDVIGLPWKHPRVSAKLGIGVKDVLECVVRDIPAPPATLSHLKALILIPSMTATRALSST